MVEGEVDEGDKPARSTILDRLSDAIRQQNWFAVVLEFLIVTAGVLMGIQVSNWNQERKDQREITRLLERIEPDVRIGITTSPHLVAYFESRMALAEKAERLWMTGEDDAELVEAAYLTGSYALAPDFDRDAYELRMGSDTVSRVKDDDLREAVANLIELRARPTLTVNYIESDFRKIVRRIYPIETSTHISQACNVWTRRDDLDQSTASLRAISTDDCVLELDPELAARLAEQLRADPTALGYLREHRNRLETTIRFMSLLADANRDVLEAMDKPVDQMPLADPTS